MRTIVTLIAAAAFLLHFALGCCAHHAHAAESCRNESPAKAHKHCCHGHCHEDAPAEQLPEDSDPPHTSCGENHCVFMTAGKTVISKVITVAPLFVVEPASLVQVTPVVFGIDSGGPPKLPVRVHVLHQVFLI